MTNDTRPEPTGSPEAEGASDPADNGRRQGDRRKAKQAFEGPDRRQSERRAGTDRRTSARTTAMPSDEG